MGGAQEAQAVEIIAFNGQVLMEMRAFRRVAEFGDYAGRTTLAFRAALRSMALDSQYKPSFCLVKCSTSRRRSWGALRFENCLSRSAAF
jgi:hypothetical protein